MSEDVVDTPKKLKLDNTKCVRCGIFLRKISGHKKIITVNEVEDIRDVLETESISTYDLLCRNCWKIINKVLSKKRHLYNVNVSHQQTSSHAALNQEQPSTSKATELEEVYQLTLPQNYFGSLVIDEHSSSDLSSGISNLTSSEGFTYESPVRQTVEYVEMPFSRVVASHSYCFLCHSKENLVDVPFDARLTVFEKTRIIVPRKNRFCQSHLIKKRFYEEDMKMIIPISDSCLMDIKEVTKFMETLSVRVDSTIHDKIGSYSISDDQIKILTSLNWEQINYLTQRLESMRQSESRSIVQALVTFLFKMRTGNSNKLICAVLGLAREQQVSDFVDSVLKSFKQDILPKHFVYHAFSRDDLINNHTADVAKKLHDVNNKLMIICDGTYYRHQKSKNNEYQRKSYSVQKGVPLCKPFTICTSDGFVIEVAGPYYATQNDAVILKSELSRANGLRALLKKSDIFVQDQGFRDIKTELEQDGFYVLMPALKGKRKQLTTEESNKSRLVTKVRWPVEAVHGVLGKKYSILHNQLDNKLLPKAILFCKVACFLNNTFGKRFNQRLNTGMKIPVGTGIL